MIQQRTKGAAIWYSKPSHHIVSQSGFYIRYFLLNVLINEVFELIHAHSFFFLPNFAPNQHLGKVKSHLYIKLFIFLNTHLLMDKKKFNVRILLKIN